MFLQYNKQAILWTKQQIKHNTSITFGKTQTKNATMEIISAQMVTVVNHVLKFLHLTLGSALIGMMLFGLWKYFSHLENLALLSCAVLIFLIANLAWEMGKE